YNREIFNLENADWQYSFVGELDQYLSECDFPYSSDVPFVRVESF
ncbi:hypothetical protein L917_14801, partial [Phytophthora nicotianae]